MKLPENYRQLILWLWREGPMSRWELHERTGATPNAIGSVAAALMAEGLVREAEVRVASGGRPRVPLEIDPFQRHVIGLAISAQGVEICRLNLLGNLLESAVFAPAASCDELVSTAHALLSRHFNDRTLAVGLSATGFVDPRSQCILFDSVAPGQRTLSLNSIYDLARAVPLILENDLHALAARWSLTHRAPADEDVLLVYFRDGSLGAAMLVDGKPNRGCIVSANELGHMRLAVETDRCLCGHVGCLERIVSSEFLRRHGAGPAASLLEQARSFDGANAPLETVLRHLATGLANAVNFMRPHRLVVVSEMTRFPVFTDHLLRLTRGQLLKELSDLVRIDIWDQPATRSAETAGYLALANLYGDGWQEVDSMEPSQPVRPAR